MGNRITTARWPVGGRAAVGLLAVAVLAGACGSGEGAAPSNGEPPATTTSQDANAVASTTFEAPAATSPSAGNGDTTSSTTAEAPGDTTADTTDGDATSSTTAEAPGDTTADTTGDGAAPAVRLVAAKRGDEGDAVGALQERLTGLGFGVGTADGDYGRRTEAGVTAFQIVAGLEPTGEADAATVEALTSFRYDGPVLRPGDEGPAVAELQERLASGPFDPGPVDGKYGTATVEAVWALAKLAGLPVDSDWGPADEKAWALVAAGAVGQPAVSHDQRWVEVDLSEQLMKVYDPGSTEPTLVSHVSSGSGVPWANENHSGSSITPKGDFEIYRRISGWRVSSLDIGSLYNPLYFTGGIAFHGALSVPLYPASHGCVRVPMHIAEYLPAELPDGTPVHVSA